MQKFSISFTLGKCSVVHQTNVAHSNREFIARNVEKGSLQVANFVCIAGIQ